MMISQSINLACNKLHLRGSFFVFNIHQFFQLYFMPQQIFNLCSSSIKDLLSKKRHQSLGRGEYH